MFFFPGQLQVTQIKPTVRLNPREDVLGLAERGLFWLIKTGDESVSASESGAPVHKCCKFSLIKSYITTTEIHILYIVFSLYFILFDITVTMPEETVMQSCCSGSNASVPLPRFHKREKAVGGMSGVFRDTALVVNVQQGWQRGTNDLFCRSHYLIQPVPFLCSAVAKPGSDAVGPNAFDCASVEDGDDWSGEICSLQSAEEVEALLCFHDDSFGVAA